MSETHSTAPACPGKPAKPTPDYPLTPHATGRWCKKIKGKVRYFGRWDDPEGAQREYEAFLRGERLAKDHKPGSSNRPAKPYPEYPLFAHASGQWAKKIRGKTLYFGPWADPDAALTKYLEQKDALHAGRKPRLDAEAVTLKELVNAFLNHKQALLDNGELSPRTWAEYKETCDLIVVAFGKARLAADLGPEDFAVLRKRMAKRWGPVRLGNAIQRVHSVFKHATENDLIDRVVRFGQGFARPSKKVLRLHKAKQGPKLFTAEEIRRLIAKADVQVRAMILLGVNAGYGNHDIATLPLAALDLEAAWLDFPRPKTGVPRRCPLWPETVAALREVIAQRPQPRQDEAKKLVFVTVRGRQWLVRGIANPVSVAVRRLMKTAGIHRAGLGHYTLRHVFRTVADGTKDQPSIDHVMGHSREDMASAYRETISDARLKAVSDYVRDWLFPPREGEPGHGGQAGQQ